MKKILALIFILAPIFLAAESSFDLFVKKDYEGAEKKLQEQLEKESENPLTHFNLAVVEEKQEKKGLALYHYLQTLQIAPDLSEARNNMGLLSRDLGVKIPKTLTEQHSEFSAVVVAFFIFLYIFTALLIRFIFKPGWKVKIALIPALMFLLLASIGFIYKYREVQTLNYAVIVTATDIMTGPDAALSSTGRLKEGEIVTVVDISSGWAKLKSFQSHLEGWVDLSAIRHLKTNLN